jgi:hypothetical protein
VATQLGPSRTDVFGMDNTPTVEQMLLLVTWPLGDTLEHVMWTWSLVAAVWGDVAFLDEQLAMLAGVWHRPRAQA